MKSRGVDHRSCDFCIRLLHSRKAVMPIGLSRLSVDFSALEPGRLAIRSAAYHFEILARWHL